MTDNEYKLEKVMKEFSCTKCPNRKDVKPLITNLGTQCALGYKQNPKTLLASRNLVANGGNLCFKHPLKYLSV
jgi:hypothetical protein